MDKVNPIKWKWIIRWQASKREICQVNLDLIPRTQKHSFVEMTPTNGSENVRWTKFGNSVTLKTKKLKT